jgi:hypothetical protein
MALLLSARKKLGILHSDVGTHSICSGAAMAMYLAGVPIISIMLIRCWPSLAILKYIRKQVQEFFHSISSKMKDSRGTILQTHQ